MFDKIIWPIISGVISTLLSTWITSAWQGLSTRDRWLISAAFGVGVAITVLVILSRRSATKSSQDKPEKGKTDKIREGVTDNKVKRNLVAEDVTLEGVDRGFSGNETDGNFIIKGSVMRNSDE